MSNPKQYIDFSAPDPEVLAHQAQSRYDDYCEKHLEKIFKGVQEINCKERSGYSQMKPQQMLDHEHLHGNPLKGLPTRTKPSPQTTP